MKLTTGERIANAACEWLGTPYQNNAMVKGKGVDCSYLLVAAVVDSALMNIADFNIENYSNEWHLHRSEEKYLKYVKQVADEVMIFVSVIFYYTNMDVVFLTVPFILVTI